MIKGGIFEPYGPVLLGSEYTILRQILNTGIDFQPLSENELHSPN